MAETTDAQTGLVRTPASADVKYYVKADAVADTASIIKATPDQFRAGTGTTVFQVKDVTSLKNTTTLPTANRGAVFNQTLIQSMGGQAFVEQGLIAATQAVANKRSEVILQGGEATLPKTKGVDTILGRFERTAVEAVQALFSPANREGRNFNTPNTRKGKIGGGGVLKYPLDMDTTIQDFLQIAIFGYKPGGIPGIREGTDQSRFTRQRLEEPREIIQIPIPNAIADQNAVMWGGGEMTSTSGEAAGAVVGALMPEDNENLFQSAGKLGGSLADSFAAGLADPFVRRRKLAGLIASGLAAANVNIDVNQAITRIGGVIENPNLELLFTGPSLRTFDFSIRFSPRNDRESARVRTIIRVLKERSAVKKGVTVDGLVSASSKNLLLGTPDVFRLQYRKAGSTGLGAASDIKGLNKFKTCALTNISVDYLGGEGRYAVYDLDSQPITTVVTLAFSELVPLYDEDYRGRSDEFPQGFSDDDVGF